MSDFNLMEKLPTDFYSYLNFHSVYSETTYTPFTWPSFLPDTQWYACQQRHHRYTNRSLLEESFVTPARTFVYKLPLEWSVFENDLIGASEISNTQPHYLTRNLLLKDLPLQLAYTLQYNLFEFLTITNSLMHFGDSWEVLGISPLYVLQAQHYNVNKLMGNTLGNLSRRAVPTMTLGDFVSQLVDSIRTISHVNHVSKFLPQLIDPYLVNAPPGTSFFLHELSPSDHWKVHRGLLYTNTVRNHKRRLEEQQ
jgi:hypothetical protein